MTVHELKTWPRFFEAVADERKTFEVRVNDRNYRVGDTLWLREWLPGIRKYTGLELRRRVSFILTNDWGLAPGTVCMALAAVDYDLDASDTTPSR